jgi:replicative DNA helicase
MSDPLINVEAEAELLGSLMRDNSSLERAIDLLGPDDFHEPVHGRIFAAMAREASLGKQVHPVALKSYFENDEGMGYLGGVGYLARLTGLATGLLATETAKQLADLAQRRRMRAGLTTAAEACSDIEATMGEIIAHADAAVSEKANDVIHQPTGGECFDELIAGFGANEKGVTCWQIGSLDNLLGPMKPKQLVIGAGHG